MPEPITVWRARNGKRFDDLALCTKYEETLDFVEEVLAKLKPRPASPEFFSGEGYVQQSPEVVEEVKRDLITRFRQDFPTWWAADVDPSARHISHFARRTEECGSALYNGFIRLYQIDSDSREWGQLYFALNPGEGEQREVEA
jgi:hypothetical protein